MVFFPPFTNHEVKARRQKKYNLAHGRKEIRLLQENIDVFENELSDILGMKVDDSVYVSWANRKFWFDGVAVSSIFVATTWILGYASGVL